MFVTVVCRSHADRDEPASYEKLSIPVHVLHEIEHKPDCYMLHYADSDNYAAKVAPRDLKAIIADSFGVSTDYNRNSIVRVV